MVDVKRLKGSYDLAVMNYTSLQTEDSKAAMVSAKKLYEAGLEAAEEEAEALEAFADEHSDEDIEDAQWKLDALKLARAGTKASTVANGVARSVPKKPDVAAKAVVTPNRQPAVAASATNPAIEVVVSPSTTDQDGTDATGGGAGESSSATKAAQELAGSGSAAETTNDGVEKKSE